MFLDYSCSAPKQAVGLTYPEPDFSPEVQSLSVPLYGEQFRQFPINAEIMSLLSRLKTVRHYNRKRELVQEFNAEGLDTGYEYEVQACMEALESGAIECPQMPHEETIAVMKLMDRLRDDWGLKLVGE